MIMKEIMLQRILFSEQIHFSVKKGKTKKYIKVKHAFLASNTYETAAMPKVLACRYFIEEGSWSTGLALPSGAQKAKHLQHLQVNYMKGHHQLALPLPFTYFVCPLLYICLKWPENMTGYLHKQQRRCLNRLKSTICIPVCSDYILP